MKKLELNAKSIFGALISLLLLFVMIYVISRAWRSGSEGRLLGYRMGGNESSFGRWDTAPRRDTSLGRKCPDGTHVRSLSDCPKASRRKNTAPRWDT